MARLANEIKELRILIQKMDELMPQYSKTDLKKLLPEINFTPIVKKPEPIIVAAPTPQPVSAAREEAKAQPKPEPKPKAHPKPQIATPVSEFDKITKALEDVQRKLQNL